MSRIKLNVKIKTILKIKTITLMVLQLKALLKTISNQLFLKNIKLF
jgi:hypothetical protein